MRLWRPSGGPVVEPCRKSLLNYRFVKKLGMDYRISHSLVRACSNEINIYKCSADLSKVDEHLYLAYVLLCLENAVHSGGGQLSGQCQAQVRCSGICLRLSE